MIDESVDIEPLTVVKLLERSGLSQNKLAKKLGIRSNTLTDWKKGTVPDQPPSVYWRIMRECNCTLEELIEALEGPEVLAALKADFNGDDSEQANI